jgi:hypothetical protein
MNKVVNLLTAAREWPSKEWAENIRGRMRALRRDRMVAALRREWPECRRVLQGGGVEAPPDDSGGVAK